MKKLSQILAVGVITLTPFVVSSSAFAAGTCQIGYTGPDSDNKCTLTEKYSCEVDNENKITVFNDNMQEAGTGTATSSGNTEGGSAGSGSATNSNGTSFDVVITNGDVCEVTKTVPASVTPDEPTKQVVPAPVGGGGAAAGGGGGAGAVAVLPDTSSNAAILGYVAGVVGALGAGAIVSRMAVNAYGRVKSQ